MSSYALRKQLCFAVSFLAPLHPLYFQLASRSIVPSIRRTSTENFQRLYPGENKSPNLISFNEIHSVAARYKHV